MIDAHVHFWKYDKVKDAWLTDEMRMLQRDFLPPDLHPVLKNNNVTGVVAVQSDQSETETKFLLSLSEEYSFIKGIVGWIDFQNEDVEQKLVYYSKFPLIKGFRHIVQAEPAGFLENENFLRGIEALPVFGFTYDILIYERQLKEAISFVNKFPAHRFMIDHCAKPDIKNSSIEDWKSGMEEIAMNENVSCKLSGLITEAKWNAWTEKDIFPYLDIVFESFGTERIVFGSDWPVMLLSGKYGAWKNLLDKYIDQFSPAEKQKIFGENAIRFYKLVV